MPKKSKVIDEKDRKILEELDNNSRQTDSQIAKKVGLSKQVVNYRISQLIKNGIIMNFYTIVNTGLFGLDSFYVFLNLEYINKDQEKGLLEKLNSLDFVGWLVSGTGRWDVVLLINAPSISIFEKYLDKIKSICGKHLHTYIFTALVDAEHIGYKMIGDRPYLMGIKRNEKIKTIPLTKSDELILRTISQNARMPITEISEKTKIPLHIVNYRLKTLIKNKVITGFKPQLSISKLGYQWHLLLIQLKIVDEKRKKEFMMFCKHHPRIYYITNSIGTYNVMLDIHVNNVEEYRETLLDIKDKFSDIIRDYESIIVFEEYKISYLPEI
jgi:Lrp/AsnC family transcriptional regulator, leucine-responsive regulatory protein